MYCVYILKSLKDKNLYVGCTSDLKSRLQRHKSGEVRATKNRRPLCLVYCEKIESKANAFTRERYLKSLYGYKEKRKLIKSFGKEILL